MGATAINFREDPGQSAAMSAIIRIIGGGGVSSYWVRYKISRFFMWLGWGISTLFGVIPGVILFVLIYTQKYHWHAHNLDLVTGTFRAQVEGYAKLRHGRFERWEHYTIEGERTLKRDARRATHRIGIATRHRIIWAYFTKLPNGLMQAESPAAYGIIKMPKE